MTSSTYDPDPDFDPIGSRFNEVLSLAIDTTLHVLFEEQAAAEFHTANPIFGPQ